MFKIFKRSTWLAVYQGYQNNKLFKDHILYISCVWISLCKRYMLGLGYGFEHKFVEIWLETVLKGNLVKATT